MAGWLDVSACRCPDCGQFYVDASWYILKMGSDVECGNCGATFNSRNYVVDRVMLKFKINEAGEIQNSKITEHLNPE